MRHLWSNGRRRIRLVGRRISSRKRHVLSVSVAWRRLEALALITHVKRLGKREGRRARFASTIRIGRHGEGERRAGCGAVGDGECHLSAERSRRHERVARRGAVWNHQLEALIFRGRCVLTAVKGQRARNGLLLLCHRRK